MPRGRERVVEAVVRPAPEREKPAERKEEPSSMER